MILTIGHTKGGCGKTTLALNLAIARARQGRAVWLIDGDRQGTAQTAVSLRSESEQDPPIACATYPDGSVLRSQVRAQSARFEDVIIDAGGRDSTALRAALVLSDVFVAPFLPRSFDVWALTDIGELIDEARSLRDGLQALAVLNAADPGSRSLDNEQAIEAIRESTQFDYLDAPLGRRKAFANAAGSGLSVLEARPRDPKAIAELNALMAALFHDYP